MGTQSKPKKALSPPKNDEESIPCSVSLTGTVITFANEMMRAHGYNNFSAYVAELIRRDRDRVPPAPSREGREVNLVGRSDVAARVKQIGEGKSNANMEYKNNQGGRGAEPGHSQGTEPERSSS